MLHRPVRLRVRVAEYFEGLVLGRGGKCEITGVGKEFFGLHEPVDLVFERFVLVRGFAFGKRLRYGGSCPSALTGMGFVNNDSETTVPMFVSDLVQDEGEFLHRGNNDLLPGFDEFPQV